MFGASKPPVHPWIIISIFFIQIYTHMQEMKEGMHYMTWMLV